MQPFDMSKFQPNMFTYTISVDAGVLKEVGVEVEFVLKVLQSDSVTSCLFADIPGDADIVFARTNAEYAEALKTNPDAVQEPRPKTDRNGLQAFVEFLYENKPYPAEIPPLAVIMKRIGCSLDLPSDAPFMLITQVFAGFLSEVAKRGAAKKELPVSQDSSAPTPA
jgi:hypothetical protein